MKPGIQKSIWANGAGDDWLERNRSKLGIRDAASEAIKAMKIQPKSVLEVGCSNGWRLQKMKDLYGCEVTGIDVSALAVKEAREAGLNVIEAGAEKLPFPDNSFDMVIYGFCLCFISPEDWLPLVLESDRVLQEGGHVVVYDFFCTEYVKRRVMGVMRDSNIEKTPVYIFNYNWPLLWKSHPAFRVLTNFFDLSNAECCSILRKSYDDILFDYDETGEQIK